MDDICPTPAVTFSSFTRVCVCIKARGYGNRYIKFGILPIYNIILLQYSKTKSGGSENYKKSLIYYPTKPIFLEHSSVISSYVLSMCNT